MRLKPLTDDLPKPMVPIMNKPLLERSMENLRKCGIRDIVISTGYKSQYIQEYFGSGSKFGLNIEYVCEDFPMGTGGAIKKTSHLYDDTFLVFNADILCNMDFTELVKYHKAKSADVTIAVTRVDNPSAYGVIEYDKNGYAVTFTEKPKADKIKSNYINAGVYVFEPEILREIPENIPISIERETFPQILQNGHKIAVYSGCSYWMDIGTPERYMQTHQDIMAGDCCLSGIHFNNHGVFIELNSKIDSTAEIIGPVYIGSNATIGPYATVGPNAVIGDDVIVHMGCNVTNSILWNNVHVGAFSAMDGVVAASSFKVPCKGNNGNSSFINTDSTKLAGALTTLS